MTWRCFRSLPVDVLPIVISLGWLMNRHVVPLDDYFSPRLKGIVSNQQGLDEDTSHACNNDPH